MPSSFHLNLFVLVLMQYLIIKIVINYILPKQKVFKRNSFVSTLGLVAVYTVR